MNKSIAHRLSSLAALCLMATLQQPAWADALDDIKTRGTLIVGGKSNYKPFGVRDANGEFSGFSVDIARKVAEHLGVKLQIVPTEAANQIQFLQQGKIDILIAAMNDTPERRKIVEVIEPGYYASSANILLNRQADVRSWDDLKDKAVCGNQGAYFNRSVQQQYGANVVAYKSPPEAYSALLNGQCIGFVFDDNSLTQRLEEPQWSGFHMPLPSIQPQPIAMAARNGETRLAATLTALSEDWYRNGYIRKLEEKWFPGKQSDFVAQQQNRFLSQPAGQQSAH